MGGKVKQANRTKNNVRPSSSGRSAELIAKKVDPSLVLVGPGNVLPTVFPSLGGGSTENPLSNDFLLCFKKFHKKDPITKVKAINELKDLVANSKQEEVVNALQSWAHYYPSLTMDIDRKVREATQVCHGMMVRKCGRQAARHLRRLLPAWLLAQHDDFAPAQLVAEADLNKTFPNEKLAEAIKFCKMEIYHFLMENLKGNTGFMLSGKNIEDEAEKEAQFARVTGSSLQALEVFICKLLDADEGSADWLWDALLPLLCANSYWKLATHSSDFVRSSWYAATGTVVQRFAGRLAADGARRAARALAEPPDAAPRAAAQRWRAVLAYMRHVQDWTTYMNTDLLVKRLLDVLNNAAWGEARQLSGLVLPVAAHLPPHILTYDFYVRFFTALFTGLNQKTVHSKIEREHWNNLIAECILYVSTRHHADEYVNSLIDFTIRTWLDVVVDPDSQAKVGLIKSTTTNMASLAKFWYNQAKENTVYEKMLQDFWTIVEEKLRGAIKKLSPNETDISNLIDAQTLFVTSLKTAVVSGEKKKHGIKFEDEDNVVPEKTPDIIDSEASTVLQQNITEIATKLIGDYFDFARSRELTNIVISRLTVLMKEYSSKELFKALQVLFNVNSTLDLYSSVFKQWLLDKKLRCKAIVQVVFESMQYLTEQEQDTVCQSFAELPPKVMEWCLSIALSHPYRCTAYVKKWMHSDIVNSTMISVCKREDEEAKSLLLKALAHDDNEEVMVSEKTINALITTCIDMINSLIETDIEIISPEDGDTRQETSKSDKKRNPDSDEKEEVSEAVVRLEARVAFVAELLHAVPTQYNANTVPLLLTLFRLTLNVPRESGAAAVAARARAVPLPPAAARDYAQRALRALHCHLVRSLKTLDIQRIDHMASLCLSLVAPGEGLPPPADVTRLVDHSRVALRMVSDASPRTPLDVFALQADLIWGNICCPQTNNDFVARTVNNKSVLTVDDLMHQVYTMLFRALYIKAILLRKFLATDDGEEETWCDVMLRVPYFQEQFCNILHDCVVLGVLYDYYVFWRHYDIIREVKEHMDNIVRDIVTDIPADVYDALFTSLAAKADTLKFYWIYARKYYKDVSSEVKRTKEVEKVSTNDNQDELESKTSDFEIVEKADVASTVNLDNAVAKLLSAEERSSLSNDEISLLLNVLDEDPERILQHSESNSRKLSNFTLLHNYLYEIQMRAAIITRARLKAELQDESQDNDESADSTNAFVYFAKNMAMIDSYSKLYGEVASQIPEFIQDFCNNEDYLDAVINGYYRCNETMLYERDMASASWLQVSSMAAVAELLSEAVARGGWRASAARWDFVNITVCSVLSSLHLSMHMWNSLQVSMVARATLRLFAAVRRFVRGVPAGATLRQPAAHVAALPHEWDDIFAPDATKTLYLIICHVLESCSEDVSVSQVAIIESLIDATKYLDSKAMPAVLKTGQITLERIVQCATNALTKPSHHGFMYLAYYTLLAVAPSLVAADEETLKSHKSMSETNSGSAEGPRLWLARQCEVFERLLPPVDAALAALSSDCAWAEVAGRWAGAAAAARLLLLALSAHALAELASEDLAQHYAADSRSRAYVECTLRVATRLLPAPVAAYMASSARHFPAHFLRYFHTPPRLILHQAFGAEAVGALACRATYAALGGAGGAARGWWGALSASAARAVQRLTAAAVAPALVADQLRRLARDGPRLLGDDVQITTNLQQMWASCSLKSEEKEKRFYVRYSPSHPLLPPTTEPNWLFIYLGYKNGSLLKAAQMWLQALDSQEGDRCCVCYCRLHADEKKASVSCQQCRNLFHKQCLRRWFNTNARSNCPACRTNF